ncbi:MAG: protoporphyrinogen oxidase [Chlorobi bacterium]|nr:protoporphyrinogen oxidase [Chlorobiota bacterium]
MQQALIIGGGISGAALLHYLALAGEDVLLLEKGERLGGVIGTHRNDAGALVETGPNSTQTSSPAILHLIESLGLGGQMIQASPLARNRYILRGGKLLPVPTSPPAFLRSQLFSVAAKLRLLREPFVGRATVPEESVAEFVRRRIGPEFLEYAINPFVSGVYAGRPERLSLQHAFPKMHNLEQQYGSLIRGAIRGGRARRKGARQGETPRDRAKLISFQEGMGTLPAAIEQRWRDRIRLGTAVQRLERDDDGWVAVADAGTFRAARVVLAADAATAANLLQPHHSGVAGALREIEYPPVAVAVSLYRRADIQHPLDGFGMLIPEVEHRKILGVIFSSTLFPNRAPEGMIALTTFIGGARQPELPLLGQDRLAELVYAEHAALLGASTPPRSFNLTVWNRAIPQYNVGYGRVLDSIAGAELALPGLHLLGNYRGGVSVADCIQSARSLATAIA